jgi:hypothetical protein
MHHIKSTFVIGNTVSKTCLIRLNCKFLSLETKLKIMFEDIKITISNCSRQAEILWT